MKSLLWKIQKRSFSSNTVKLQLPKLDYGLADLEPVLSKELVELHYTKHHQTYIDNYNKFVDMLQEALNKGDLDKITYLTKEIKFNGGSHINHSIYWKNLASVKGNLNNIIIINC